MKRWLSRLTFRQAAWLLPCAWVIHEAEEWNIDAWYRQHFVDPGYFSQMDGAVLWVGLAFVASQGVVWTAVATLPRNPRVVAFLVLPYFIVISFGNAFHHIFFQFYFGAYAPGVVTAVLLLMPATVFVAVKAVRERLVPWWYVGLLLVVMMPGVVSVVRSGNHVSPEFQRRHVSGMQMARTVLGWASGTR